VLAYRYGPQLQEGVEEQYRRSCYIHPLYGLDGEPITDDFPDDHYHHRGVFWTWPHIEVAGRTVQTWHPSGLRQRFVRWVERDADGDAATLTAENAWALEDGETVARTRVTMRVHPAEEQGRAIDMAVRIEPIGTAVTLRGQERKGYGGLCVRAAPDLTGGAVTTDQGTLDGDAVNKRFAWADLSNEKRGVAVFVDPNHREAPLSWLIRQSYGGVLNPEWPGTEPRTLEPGDSVTLRYRLYVHRGDAERGAVRAAYQRYRDQNR
jgi:hypothetical protein